MANGTMETNTSPSASRVLGRPSGTLVGRSAFESIHPRDEARARGAFNVVVQISDDPEFKKDVTTVYNNDATNELGLGKGKDYCYYESNEGRVIPVAAVKGRYVRFHSKGNSAGPSNDYIEAEVWGVPAK